MLINHLPPTIYIELIVGFLLWWFAIYLLTLNPLDRATQILFLIFASLGFYFTSDLFFVAAFSIKQYGTLELLLKISTWTIYLPFACLYHLSYLALKKKALPQTILLYFSYVLTAAMVYLEIGTDLLRNYTFLSSPSFNGDLATATSKYFWVVGVFFLLLIFATLANFLKLLLQSKRFSREWWKYFWPSLGMVINLILGPIILLSYYGLVSHSILLPALDFFLTAFFFIYAVLKYRLFIEDPKLLFGKNFLYSTVAITIIIGLISLLFFLRPAIINHVGDLIIPVLIINFVTACLPIYNWLNTFINDLLYNPSSGLSVVNDSEINQALRNYQNRSRLEDNPLLRLNIIKKKIQNREDETPVDALRATLKQAIEYFKPEDEKRRTKQHLKYYFLRMFTYDQAEEGQILWELGFEGYPVRIMTNESKTRPPLFKITSPSEYSYISRNAFIALKKEAIHDITWRISYLEKLVKKK